jgi:hypothetical protein
MDGNGIVIVAVALMLSTAIPVFLAWKWGWPIAFTAVAIWTLVWIASLRQGDLSWPDAIGTSLLPALLWLIGAGIGLWLHGRGGNPAVDSHDS